MANTGTGVFFLTDEDLNQRVEDASDSELLNKRMARGWRLHCGQPLLPHLVVLQRPKAAALKRLKDALDKKPTP